MSDVVDEIFETLGKEARRRFPGEKIECTLLGHPPASMILGEWTHLVPRWVVEEARRVGLRVVLVTDDRYVFEVMNGETR